MDTKMKVVLALLIVVVIIVIAVVLYDHRKKEGVTSGSSSQTRSELGIESVKVYDKCGCVSLSGSDCTKCMSAAMVTSGNANSSATEADMTLYGKLLYKQYEECDGMCTSGNTEDCVDDCLSDAMYT
jgi:hypothetical protein